MSEVLFKIKFPEEYYEYDDVENLSYHCVKDLKCSIDELNLTESFKIEDVVNSFRDHIDNKNSESSIFKWFFKIVNDSEVYLIESVANLGGGDFLLTHGLLQIELFENSKLIDSKNCELSDFDWDAFFITKPKENFSSSDLGGLDSIDIDKIKMIAQKVIDDNDGVGKIVTLLTDSGFEVKQKFDYPLRYEIKVEEKNFTVINKSLLDNLPSQISFEVGFLIGFNGVIKK
tara:strand:- start:664 stop:1353 length:690 start_codon:yes stop_codon:yes gene_type:complete